MIPSKNHGMGPLLVYKARDDSSGDVDPLAIIAGVLYYSRGHTTIARRV